MSDWNSVPFASLAAPAPSSFSIGPFGSKITKENYVASGVPVVRGVNLSRGRFLDGEFVFISDDKADELHSSILLSGDLVFTHRGTLGQVSMIPRIPIHSRYILSSSQVKARLDDRRALPEFYYYWFRSPAGQDALLVNASTVGVPGIASPLSTIRSISVPVPPLPKQKLIAEVLGALDDKIAENQDLSVVADALGRARFQSCMVQADAEVVLGDLVDLVYGKALREPDRRAGHAPVFGCTGRVGWHDVALTSGPGAVVGRKGANAGAVSWSHRPCWVIDTAFYVEPRNIMVTPEFAYFLLRDVGLEGLVGDSAVPGLNRTAALSRDVTIPNASVVGQFTRQVQHLLALIDSAELQNRTLAELRDALLPKLMSGEIRVRDAEKIVEDVT